MQKVGELAERNPHETVAIVRQWLQDAPGLIGNKPMAAAARRKSPDRSSEIANLVATLAGRQSSGRTRARQLKGPGGAPPS